MPEVPFYHNWLWVGKNAVITFIVSKPFPFIALRFDYFQWSAQHGVQRTGLRAWLSDVVGRFARR